MDSDTWDATREFALWLTQGVTRSAAVLRAIRSSPDDATAADAIRAAFAPMAAIVERESGAPFGAIDWPAIVRTYRTALERGRS